MVEFDTSKESANDDESHSDRPPRDLQAEREELFVQRFSKGAALTRELLQEFEVLRNQAGKLDEENRQLRVALESQTGLEGLMQRMQHLERERDKLRSQYDACRAASAESRNALEQLESELGALAGLHVASNCLHSTLSPNGVRLRLREVLEQLVGAESYAVYVLDGEHLVWVTSHGLSREERDQLRGARPSAVDEAVQSDALQQVISSQASLATPRLVLPLSFDGRIIGALAIFHLLPHKTEISESDQPLLRLISQHAGVAIASAGLFSQSARRFAPASSLVDEDST